MTVAGPGRPGRPQAGPLRIVVVGPSVGYSVRPPRRRLEEGNYGEIVERRLREDGIDATVVNTARWWLLVHEAFQAIEPLVLSHAPHIVITNFGMGECQPKVIPTDLLRWLYSWRPGSSTAARALRRLITRPINSLYVNLSPRVIRAVPSVPSRVAPARFELEMRRFVAVVRKERKALVLMINASPPGARLEQILPGTDARARRFNAIMDRVASDAGHAVRVIDAYGLAMRHGPDRLLPDGIHFSAEGHEKVAEELFQEIRNWLASRRASGVGTLAAVPEPAGPGGHKQGPARPQRVAEMPSRATKGERRPAGPHAAP